MSYASERDNQASKKFSLIRLEPARFINDDLTDNGDGTYTITLDNFVISKIEENGVGLTKTTGTLSSGQYSFTDNTGELIVYPSSAPSSTNSIIAFYYLFYTSQRIRTANEDPEDTSTTTRNWLPRIETSPTISQSVINVDEGFFEISSSLLTILNDQNEFFTYLTDNDSFYNKKVEVWFCIDEIDNIQKAFIGVVTKINVSNRFVEIEVKDNLSKIGLPATMSDGRQYTYWNTADYTSMHKERTGTPIPFFFGRTSRYQTLSNAKSDLSDSVFLDPDSLYEAVCTNFNNTINGTNNRVWGIGRVPSYGLQQVVHSISTSYHGSSNYTRFTIATHSSIFVGDSGLATASSNQYAQVIYVDSDNSYVYTEKLTAQDYSSLTLNGVSIVVNQTSVNYYPLEGRDYTVLTESTDASNSYVYIQFTNSFENTLSGMSFVDPTFHSVKFRIKPNHDYASHGTVAKYILDKVGGITTDSSTYTQADVDLVSNVAFSIPNFDESDFNNYTKYFGDLLKSTFGYFRLNNSFEVEYKLFSTPSDSTAITQYQIIQDQYSVEIEYQDIINEIIAYNPHYNSVEHVSSSGTSLKNIKARYLHGIDRTIRFRHVLESISTKLIDIFNNKKERKARYSISTKTINLDSIIGLDFNMSYNVISGDSTRSMKLIQISKSPSQSDIVLDDFLNV